MGDISRVIHSMDKGLKLKDQIHIREKNFFAFISLMKLTVNTKVNILIIISADYSKAS